MAGKINRIFERFGLATVDMGSVKTEIRQTREEKSKSGEDIPTPERTAVEDKLEQFLEAVTTEQPNPTAEQPETENPTMARTAKSVRPSLPPGAEAPEATWASLSGKLPAPPCGRSCGRFAGSRDRSRRRLTGNGYTFPRASKRMRR